MFLLSESTDKFERRLALVWSFSERGIGKDDLWGDRSCIYGQQGQQL